MTASALTPRQIVAELDRHIVGQKAAKRAVAIALRNRWRRQHVGAELRDEIAPKNLILIGPTGVGKTEIARRLAKLVAAPFVKVEASKYTEVGYVGRDVESMVRDLVEAAIGLVRAEESERVKAAALEAVEEKLLELLAPQIAEERAKRGLASGSRDVLRDELRAGRHDERSVEVEVTDAPATPSMQLFGPQGMEELGVNLQELFGQLGAGAAPRGRKRKATVAEARRLLEQEETRRRVDPERVKREAVRRAEESGIIFLDEIDKIAGPRGQAAGPDVSREGVQRDLLPIVEGSTVPTKYGPVKTDHVLFIAAGAFHVSKPSDLIPELQGRFPIRVELDSLRRDDFVRILKEPRSSLLRQCEALLQTEGVELTFTDDAVEELARVAQLANERSENIGARRLHTVLERVLDEVSFEASELPPGHAIRVDAAYVKQKLDGLFASEDLSRFIL